MQITKRVEFDYGHRVPSHNSKCKNLHGHRGVLEVTLAGEIKPIRGQSDDGMVLDFADVKHLATHLVANVWDHAFIVYEHDLKVRSLLDAWDGHKTVVVPFIPTAENLAAEAFRILQPAYRDVYGDALSLVKVRFYETPNSWADAFASENP